ncbi:MAG: polyprenyl synthetase family protein [Bacteroidota bacterium]
MSIPSSSIITLESLQRPVLHELEIFDNVFRKSLGSSIPLVDLIARYLVWNKGKRVRPLLVFLSAQISGTINERTYRAASLIEMLHTATLVHDDVVDNSDTRRGVASLNGVWKNKIAVLMGDYLLSKGLLLSLQHDDYRFLHITSEAVKRMSEGELLQIQKSRQLNIDEETYFRIIEDKTASLFSACMEIGSVSASEDSNIHAAMRDYGTHIGIAFQIRDDLLDFVGRRTLLGKPIAADIKEKKLTLPIIYALKMGDRNLSKRALRMIGKGVSRNDVAWLFGFVNEQGGIEYTVQKALDHIAKAKSSLQKFPDSPAKQSLENFSEFVLQREK